MEEKNENMDDSWSDVSVWSVSRPGVGPSEGVSTRRRGHGSICPAEPDESVFKVDLVVGKTVQVGTQNRYFFGGQIVRETISGWGFTRNIARKFGPMAGTLMAVDPDAPRVERFIRLGGDPYLIRYHSRLPVPIYVPEGVDVRYRIWSAGAEAKTLEKS